jgi:hypothetical protein
LRDVSETDLSSLLKFMYHGEVRIEEDRLKDFLKTAETLQVRGLLGDEGEQRAIGVPDTVRFPKFWNARNARQNDKNSSSTGFPKFCVANKIEFVRAKFERAFHYSSTTQLFDWFGSCDFYQSRSAAAAGDD